MNNFTYITPEEYLKACSEGGVKPDATLRELKAIAKAPAADCELCDEKEWKLAGTGLCFTCTTGEADASDDYELI